MSNKQGMTVIVKTLTRFVKGFVLLFGFYIVFYGHLTPGGGFAGGVVIASSFVLLTLAFGKEVSEKKLSVSTAALLDEIGAFAFLLIALMGMFFGGVFFINFIQKSFPGADFRLLSSGIIPFCNIAIGLKVGTSVFMIFIVISILRVVVKDGRRQMIKMK